MAAASSSIRRSSLGLKLLAIKADVDAAADVGISATFYQDLIFALSGAVVGLSGGLYASYFSFIEPNDMFGFDRSIAFVLMAVIGGVGTVAGAGAGRGGVRAGAGSTCWPRIRSSTSGCTALLLILIILFEPLGLTGLSLRLVRAIRSARRQGPGPASR